MTLSTYTEVEDTDVDVDSPMPESILEDMRDNVDTRRNIVFARYFPADTQFATDTDWITQNEFRIRIPKLRDTPGGTTRTIVAAVEVLTVSGTMEVRLYDVASATGGTAESAATGGSWAWEYPEFDFADSARGTLRTMYVQIRHTSPGGGVNINCRSEASRGWRLEF